MYLEHFGLRELPFTLTPNTEFYCELEGHQEALQVLSVALNTGEGFIKVTGEVGTGKTLLCRKLLNSISDKFVTAYVPNPYLTPSELRLAIGLELGVSGDKNLQPHHHTRMLEERLLEINASGRSVLIIIDEAQALPITSLESLRLFSNLETESRKLVQLVLFGQPELNERLARTELRQLRQRISFSYELKAITEQQVARYIQYRLDRAGYRGERLIPDVCIRWIHHGSRGIPRLINVLSHKVLLLAYGAGRKQASLSDVKAAIADTEDALMPVRQNYLWFFTSFSVVVLLAFMVAHYAGWLNA